ncbi:MAG: hypothetical protein QOE69_2518 [Thermoleophilaceae bacterium]|nr:hypothetical protein [Thermoleophilaceae bacterium]
MQRTHPCLVALIAVAFAGCGAQPAAAPPAADPGFYENAQRGYSVTIPPGWHRAERKLTVLTDPVELLVAATYRTEAGAEANCGPIGFRGFDAHQVLVMVLERGRDPASGWPDFPPRPAHFAFEQGMSSEFADCLRTTRHIPLKDHWFRFTDAGRHFHVLVVIGADVPPGSEAEAYRLLDSLRFDASVKPDWPSSG